VGQNNKGQQRQRKIEEAQKKHAKWLQEVNASIASVFATDGARPAVDYLRGVVVGGTFPPNSSTQDPLFEGADVMSKVAFLEGQRAFARQLLRIAGKLDIQDQPPKVELSEQSLPAEEE
jgi:hypothetical protein